MRQLLGCMDAAVLRKKSSQACRLLVNTAEFQSAHVVMMFLSLPDEIDSSVAIKHALIAHKRVAVPRVDFAQKIMLPVELKNLDEEMFTDRYGIKVPLNSAHINIADIDLVVVPGLGFDTQGNRLGRGGGYYDKFLSNPRCRAIKCGFAFEEQLIESIPMHNHDIKVDMLVTDNCMRRFGNS